LTLVSGYRSAMPSTTSSTSAYVSLVALEARCVAKEVVTISANVGGSKW
jgi:hypothetical protein